MDQPVGQPSFTEYIGLGLGLGLWARACVLILGLGVHPRLFAAAHLEQWLAGSLRVLLEEGGRYWEAAHELCPALTEQ